jgi:molybdopterin biosynthesis enzyme
MVTLGAGLAPHPELTLLTPVRRRQTDDGRLEASAVAYHGSGDLAALAACDGFVEIPPGQTNESRHLYSYYPFDLPC